MFNKVQWLQDQLCLVNLGCGGGGCEISFGCRYGISNN